MEIVCIAASLLRLVAQATRPKIRFHKIKAKIYLVSKPGICTCRVKPTYVQNERLSHNVSDYR
jgi:hypothetical protein